MLHEPFSKEISHNIQPRPLLVQLEAISHCLIAWYLDKVPDPYLTTTSFKVIAKGNKVSPESSFLQAKQL